MVLSSLVFPFVASRAELSSLWDYDVSETFDVDTSSDFYTLYSDPLWESPDQVSQEMSGLVSDPDTDLWAEVSDECSLDGPPINDIQKRNGVCPNSESRDGPGNGFDPNQLAIPSRLEAGREATDTVNDDDQDICITSGVVGARYMAVCDSGRDDDRILNGNTGEYSLFNCERRKLRGSSIARVKPIIQTFEADERRQSVCLALYGVPAFDRSTAVLIMSYHISKKFVFKSESSQLWAT